MLARKRTHYDFSQPERTPQHHLVFRFTLESGSDDGTLPSATVTCLSFTTTSCIVNAGFKKKHWHAQLSLQHSRSLFFFYPVVILYTLHHFFLTCRLFTNKKRLLDEPLRRTRFNIYFPAVHSFRATALGLSHRSVRDASCNLLRETKLIKCWDCLNKAYSTLVFSFMNDGNYFENDRLLNISRV